MKTLGNIIWFVCGGFFMGLGWWLVGALAMITIIGIPWAKACFVIGQFAFWPFGKEARERTGQAVPGKDQGITGIGIFKSACNALKLETPLDAKFNNPTV